MQNSCYYKECAQKDNKCSPWMYIQVQHVEHATPRYKLTRAVPNPQTRNNNRLSINPIPCSCHFAVSMNDLACEEANYISC